MRRGCRAAFGWLKMAIHINSRRALLALYRRFVRRVAGQAESTTLVRCLQDARHAWRGGEHTMFRHGHARRAVLLLMVLAVAVMWTADQSIRAAASDRADKSATPARTADKVVTGATAKESPPATTAAAEPQTAKGKGQAKGKVTRDEVFPKRFQKVAPSEQKAAAIRAAKLGMKPGVAGLPGVTGDAPLPADEGGPGGVPRYFGPYGNWAFSPLPRGAVTEVTIVDGGVGYTSPTVTITDAYGTATTPATVTATVVGGVITGFTDLVGGAEYSAPVVTITDPTGAGAVADAVIGGTPSGGLPKFVDALKSIPVGVPDVVTYPGSDYYEIALLEYEEKFHSALPLTRLRGYVQTNNGTDTANCDPVGMLSNPPKPVCTIADNTVVPAPISYLGPLIVAQGRVHGIQVEGIADPGDPRPVRVKFVNQLPTGDGGDLFLPVDESVPGSAQGPALPGTFNDKFKQNRATIHLHGNNTIWLSDGNVHQWITPAGESTVYPAGVSARNVPDMPGCEDPGGTDPLLPGRSGCMTFYYTNAQSARLQFYHDHAHGITRLNVYAGEAAGYLLTDAVEQDMINGTNVTGVNTGGLRVLPGIGIPLVIQDRTFVDADTIFAQDPTWNWGTGPRVGGNITGAVTGDLWFPHVYMTVQNPWDLTGTNAFGKWHYGPWFNPPTPACPGDGSGEPGCIEVGPVPNEYADPADPFSALNPPMRPGVPNPSSPGEAFLDTPIVNGVAYPYLEVPAGPVRFRILNAANDRFLNLQLYEAFSKVGFDFGTGVEHPPTATQICGGFADCTEVKMVPVTVNAANQFADTPSGIPDPATAGPPWILIGTEGGFMPKPVVVPQQPVGWNLDMGYFAFGIVNQHSIFLGSAERADVIVDFSGLGGKTFILYNDSPAPVPAGAGVFDFFTGNGNQMDAGGAPNTLPGYGPNTRTIMQIRVGAAPETPEAPDFSLENLQAVFAKGPDGKRGVFEVSQDPIIVPQEAYNSAYNATFPSSAAEQFLQIGDMEKTFRPINGEGVQQEAAVTIPLEMKAMHDEMGGVYDVMYGRMSGMLGLVNPTSNVHLLIPYPYAGPPVDLVKGSIEKTLVGSLADGTQIWRIFHNGVDTHPIHTHLFHTQIVNRVDQSGQMVGDPVDPIELGWKDTVRINPLEVTFLAMRPTVPTPDQVPFEVPDSIRLIDPSLPEGATLPPPAPAGWFDPQGTQLEGTASPVNHYVNFGWEYVWHCHILSHEEMDMMHALVFAVPPSPPSGLAYTMSGNGGNRSVVLTWLDNSIKEAGYRVERASDAGFTSGLRTFNVPANTTQYADRIGNVSNFTYYYRVHAIGEVVGDTFTPNFPTMSADSVSQPLTVSGGTPPGLPTAPTNLAATLQTGPQVSLTWRDNATNETGFAIERCTGVDCGLTSTNFAPIATAPARNNTGNVTYVDTTVAFGNTYSYRVFAINSAGSSTQSTNIVSVTVSAAPSAPATFTVENSATAVNGPNTRVTLNWSAVTGAVNYTIQRATMLDFGAGETGPAAANLATFTVTGTGPLKQTVKDNTVYYYRIRANNDVGGFSAWKNAAPFPIRTGK